MPCPLHLLSTSTCPTPSFILPEVTPISHQFRVEAGGAAADPESGLIAKWSLKGSSTRELSGQTGEPSPLIKALFTWLTKDACIAAQVRQIHLSNILI